MPSNIGKEHLWDSQDSLALPGHSFNELRSRWSSVRGVLHISYGKYKFCVLKRVSKIKKQQSAVSRDEKGNCNCLGFQIFKQMRITFLSNREIEEWKAWGNGILWFKNSLAQARTAMVSMEGAVQLQDHFFLTWLGACARDLSSSSIPNLGDLMEHCQWGQRANLCN